MVSSTSRGRARTWPDSDPEEDVQAAVGDRAVAPDRARVAAPEGREHEAPRVELEDGQVLGVPSGVREPILRERDARVTGIRAGGDPDADLAYVVAGDGLRRVLPEHEHERRQQVGRLTRQPVCPAGPLADVPGVHAE